MGITELLSGRASSPLVVKVGTAPHLLVAARPFAVDPTVVLKLAPLLPGLAAATGPPLSDRPPLKSRGCSLTSLPTGFIPSADLSLPRAPSADFCPC